MFSKLGPATGCHDSGKSVIYVSHCRPRCRPTLQLKRQLHLAETRVEGSCGDTVKIASSHLLGEAEKKHENLREDSQFQSQGFKSVTNSIYG